MQRGAAPQFCHKVGCRRVRVKRGRCAPRSAAAYSGVPLILNATPLRFLVWTGESRERTFTFGRDRLRLPAIRVAVPLLLRGLAAPAAARQPFARRPVPDAPPSAVVASRAVLAVRALPGAIGRWTRRGESMDYEARSTGAGVGASAECRPDRPGVATVHRHDRGRPMLTPADVPGELRTTLRDIERAGATRNDRLDLRGAGFEVTAGAGRSMRCAPVLLAFGNGDRSDSFACLGRSGTRFPKLRLTMPKGPRSRTAVRGFAAALLAVAAPSAGSVARGRGKF